MSPMLDNTHQNSLPSNLLVAMGIPGVKSCSKAVIEQMGRDLGANIMHPTLLGGLLVPAIEGSSMRTMGPVIENTAGDHLCSALLFRTLHPGVKSCSKAVIEQMGRDLGANIMHPTLLGGLLVPAIEGSSMRTMGPVIENTAGDHFRPALLA